MQHPATCQWVNTGGKGRVNGLFSHGRPFLTIKLIIIFLPDILVYFSYFWYEGWMALRFVLEVKKE